MLVHRCKLCSTDAASVCIAGVSKQRAAQAFLKPQERPAAPRVCEPQYHQVCSISLTVAARECHRSYEEKVVCQVCDILARKSELNIIADRNGMPRPMMPEFLDRYFLNAHGATAPAEAASERFFSDLRFFAGNRLVYWFGVICGVVQHKKAPLTHSTPLSDFMLSAIRHLDRLPDSLHLFCSSGYIHRKEALLGARAALLGVISHSSWEAVATELQRSMIIQGEHVGTMHCTTWLHVILKAWAMHFTREYKRMMVSMA